MPKQSSFDLDGIVTEALGNGLYRVQLESGHEIIAHLSGKMRLHQQKLLHL